MLPNPQLLLPGPARVGGLHKSRAHQGETMVPSRILLSLTASLLGLGGIAMLFVPDAVLRVFLSQQQAPVWPVQLLAAAWCGFAALNWASRGTILGGIYGRPLVVANFVHFLIAALILVRTAVAGALDSTMWVVLVIIALLAAAYGLRLFAGPPDREMAGPRAS